MLPCNVYEGSGSATVVLLPGLFAGDWLWQAQVPFLRASHRRVLVFSDAMIKIRSKISGMDELCNMVQRTILDNAPGPYLIIGNSMGGLVSLMLACRMPDQVAGVVASGVPGLGGDTNLGLGTKNIISREYAVKVARRVFFDQSRVVESEIDRVFGEIASRHSLLQAARLLRAVRNLNVNSVLDRLRHRTLLVWGREDEVTPPGPWSEAATQHAALEFHSVAGCGHCPMIEGASEFNELIRVFMDEVLSCPNELAERQRVS
jgi:2-hydroxy-6-oxonona-2,4-dienedioate hydrolase